MKITKTKRQLIEKARKLQLHLWMLKHPSFRTDGILDYNEETLLVEHIKAFATIFNPEAATWGGLREDHLKLYIFCLQLEILTFELDTSDQLGRMDVMDSSMSLQSDKAVNLGTLTITVNSGMSGKDRIWRRKK